MKRKTKSVPKYTGLFIALIAVIAIGLVACDGDTPPTVTLTPVSVTVNNDNLTQTVTVGGTATGDITLDTTGLSPMVTATVSGTTITLTGVRPITDVPAITGSFNVGVTREGIRQNLRVNINLTTTWTETTVTLTSSSVTVDDDNLTQTVSVGGTATGDITLNIAALPAAVTATVDETTITVTGIRPTTDVPAITGSYTVGVTRQGVTQNLTVAVDLTTTWIDPCPDGHNIAWVSDYTAITDNKCDREGCTHIAGLGDIGPGGGVIFYVADGGYTNRPTAHNRSNGFTVSMVNNADNYRAYYLEAAPANATGGADGTADTMMWRVGTTSELVGLTSWPYDQFGSGGIDRDAMARINGRIGEGRGNTDRIIAFYSTHDDQTYLNAARAANNYNTATADDWFLPSTGELYWLSQNRELLDGKEGITAMPPTGSFWSSTQNSLSGAWSQAFDYFGTPSINNKGYNTLRVRPIRAF